MTDAPTLTRPTAPGRTELLCYCMRISEAEVVETICALDLRTVQDVRRCTGAGTGCTACIHHIRECLRQRAE